MMFRPIILAVALFALPDPVNAETDEMVLSQQTVKLSDGFSVISPCLTMHSSDSGNQFIAKNDGCLVGENKTRDEIENELRRVLQLANFWIFGGVSGVWLAEDMSESFGCQDRIYAQPLASANIISNVRDKERLFSDGLAISYSVRPSSLEECG